MQLHLIFPAAISLPPTMPQMHINMVRHLMMEGELKLISPKLDLGYCKFLDTRTGQTKIIEVTKKLNC